MKKILIISIGLAHILMASQNISKDIKISKDSKKVETQEATKPNIIDGFIKDPLADISGSLSYFSIKITKKNSSGTEIIKRDAFPTREVSLKNYNDLINDKNILKEKYLKAEILIQLDNEKGETIREITSIVTNGNVKSTQKTHFLKN